MKEVLVFKTSVNRSNDVLKLQPSLDRLMKANESWNFDLEDCDKILRVEVVQSKRSEIVQSLIKKGFNCIELI